MRESLVLGAAVALVVSACATTPKPAPALKRLEWGGSVATWRAYGVPEKAGICDAEPRFLLDELASVNGLLNRFLVAMQTPDGVAPEAAWPEEKIERFEEGAQVLPPALEQHELNVRAAGRCAFATSGGFPKLLERSEALVRDVRARLESVPRELEKARAAHALEAWRKQRLSSQEAARQTCPSRTPKPRVYYAWVDEAGVTRWLFCDGAQATQEGGGEVHVEHAPAELVRGRRPTSAAYLAAAKAWPEASIERPPATTPAAEAAPAPDTAAPAPKGDDMGAW